MSLEARSVFIATNWPIMYWVVQTRSSEDYLFILIASISEIAAECHFIYISQGILNKCIQFNVFLIFNTYFTYTDTKYIFFLYSEGEEFDWLNAVITETTLSNRKNIFVLYYSL